MNQFVPLYADILRELQQEGVEWVQIDEPILATAISKEEIALFNEVYQALHEAAPNIKVIFANVFLRALNIMKRLSHFLFKELDLILYMMPARVLRL
ncbi:hypothetical protein GCM10020331_086420 [Ectobacillus funiculus]